MMTTHRFGLWYATSCPPETSNIQCRSIGRYQIRLNHTKRLRTSASHSNLLFSGKGHWHPSALAAGLGQFGQSELLVSFCWHEDASAQSLDEHELTSYFGVQQAAFGRRDWRDCQWVGWMENPQENMFFLAIKGFSCRFCLKPINWGWRWFLLHSD